jgi:hypothetical protein
LIFAASTLSHTIREDSEVHTRMNQLQKKGFPLTGAIFLALGVFKFLQGGNWVVWIIVGILFGGLGAVSRRKDKQP